MSDRNSSRKIICCLWEDVHDSSCAWSAWGKQEEWSLLNREGGLRYSREQVASVCRSRRLQSNWEKHLNRWK